MTPNNGFRVLTEGLDHPEGVAWSPDGNLYAGGEAGQVYRVTLDGTVSEVATTGGFLLGLALDAQGWVYACDPANRAVARVDPGSGSVVTYSAGTDRRPMRNPNYPAFAPDGTLYVTDSGEWKAHDGLVYRVAPGGATEVWSTALPRFPNGCALAPDGSALYVAESLTPGISRLPIRDDGSAGDPEPVVELPGTVPDGLAFAAGGALYVSCYRPDRIYRVTPDSPGGAVSVVADDPEGTLLGAPTNLAFCGADLDQVAVANLGRWHLSIGGFEGVTGHPVPLPEVG